VRLGLLVCLVYVLMFFVRLEILTLKIGMHVGHPTFSFLMVRLLKAYMRGSKGGERQRERDRGSRIPTGAGICCCCVV